MKILHIEAGRHVYGGAQQVIYLIKHLAKWDVDNLLLCTEASEFAAEAQREGITTKEIKMGGDLDLLMIPRIKAAISEFQPDVVHVHSRRGVDYHGVFAAKLAGVPVVLTRRVDNPEPVWLAKRKYQWPDQTVCISEGIRQVLLEQQVPEHAAITIHSAVDTDKFVPQPRIDGFWQDQFGLPEGRQTIGIIAQMISRKGHRFLFNRLKEIVAAAPNAHVMVFGKGPLRDELEKSVDDLGIRDHVTFAGFCSNLAELVPQLDLVVHPALAEGLGVSLLQAACCKIPLVAFARGGIPELIKEGETGYLVDGGDEATMAKRIIELLTDDELRERMGDAAREFMLDKFSIEQMASGNHELYKKLMAK